MIEHILLDMDGVVVNFSDSALEAMGRPDVVVTQWNFNEHLGMTISDFWQELERRTDESWWASLPKFPWSDELIGLVKSTAPFTFATSPTRDPRSHSGKVAWIQREFGRQFRDYVMTGKKELMAKEGVVLIDDNDKNCEKFRAAGGHAICFPALYNKNSMYADENRLDIVRRELEFYSKHQRI